MAEFTTTTQPHKRHCPSPEEQQSNTISNANKVKHNNPLKAAELVLNASCRNLHPHLATILAHTGKLIIQTAHNLLNKTLQSKRLHDDTKDFIPRSARFEFKLFVTEAAKQHADYININNEVNSLVVKLQQDLKNSIAKVTDLEITVLKEKLITDICNGIHNATAAFVTLFDSSLDPTDTARYILDKYTDQVIVTNFPIDRDMVLIKFDELFQNTPPTTPAEELVFNHNGTNCCSCLLSTLTDIFVNPTKRYIETVHTNDIDSKLKSLTVTELTAPATSEAQMLLDDEPNVDAPTMRDLIKAETTKANKKIQQQLESVTLQLKQIKEEKRSGRNADINKSKKKKKPTKKKPTEKKPSEKTPSEKKPTKKTIRNVRFGGTEDVNKKKSGRRSNA